MVVEIQRKYSKGVYGIFIRKSAAFIAHDGVDSEGIAGEIRNQNLGIFQAGDVTFKRNPIFVVFAGKQQCADND
ncbi:hypothetical protein SDC9_64572 [bioreactor metagenome]|uniref:Uncharacterized protein n=1 Tax=bioreactor metagenome TaxID=1076179 RepID=A0A644XPP3_9ZZZZ